MRLQLRVALLALLVIMLSVCSMAASGAAPVDASRVTRMTSMLPLSFELAGVPERYLARSGRYAISIGPNESSVVIAGKSAPQMFRFAFDKANPAASIEALNPLTTVTNYYIGNDPQQWRLGVKNFARLRTKQIYPGIDVVYYGDQRRLEFDFVVAPNADPSPIALAFSGTDKLYTADGDLVAEIGGHSVRFAKPFAYQMVTGNRKAVNVAYVLDSAGKARLNIGDYDKNRELIIDPVVTYATYLGGSQLDDVEGIAIDVYGNAYLTGQTCSSDFPGLTQTIVTCNAYVSEISADGSSLVGNTVIIGGNNNTWGHSITIDPAGTAYIVGKTNSTNLPTSAFVTKKGNSPTVSTYFGGDSDAFVAIVSGGSLQRLAYLGGSGTDNGYGVAVDGATPPNVIATGETCYPTGIDAHPDFPAYSGFQRKVEMCVGFITKLDNLLDLYVQDPVADSYGDPPPPPSGQTTFYFSEFFGGQPPNVPTSGWFSNHRFYKGDIINATYIDSGKLVSAAERCIGTGTTAALEPLWSTTINSITNDGTVTWQNMGPPGTLTNATTISHAVATDPLGDIFAAGGSDSDFIGCDLCGDTSYYIGSGAWVAKVNKNGGWVYSTVLGTVKTDTANAIAVDGTGQAYIAGTSTGGIFMPANTTSFQSKNGGGQDAFIVELDNAGTTINYAGYLGGTGNDQGLGLAVDVNGAAYIVGSTKSPDFPTVNPLTNTKTNSAMNTLSGAEDAFVARVIPGGSAVAFSSYIGGSDADQALATTASRNGEFVFVGGSTHSFDFPTYQSDANVRDVVQTTYNKGVDNDAGDAFVLKVPIATLPNFAISPDHLDFGSQDVGTASAALPVAFTNTGNSPITITSVSASGDFAPSTNCNNITLVTNQSCVVQVTFTPTSAGTRSSTLVFHDNATGSTQSVALSGTGLSLTGGGITIDATTYAFADQQQSVASTAKVFTLTNTSSASVTFTSTPSMGGTNAGDFAIVPDPSNPANACSTSTPLAPGATCTVAVTFTPAAASARSATLSVAASTNTVTVSLTGTGTAAATTSDFTMSGPNGGVTVAVGKSQAFAISLAPVGSFSQTVTLQCVASSPATCSLASSSVQVSGTTPVSVNASVFAPAPSSSGGSGGTKYGSNHLLGPFGAMPFCAAFAFIGFKRRRWLILGLLALAMVLVSVGCGGGGASTSSGGTAGMQPGTSYSITVTATYTGGTSHTTTIPLTVTN